MKIVVALGGEIADSGLLRARVAGAELTIAADSGASRLEQAGLSPDIVIGDFDSLSEAELAALRRRGVEIVPHPDPQQQTDGHVALQLAAERGASEVVLLGAGGGERLDHQLTNLLFLVALEFAALPISAISLWTEAVGLHGRETGFGLQQGTGQAVPGGRRQALLVAQPFVRGDHGVPGLPGHRLQPGDGVEHHGATAVQTARFEKESLRRCHVSLHHQLQGLFGALDAPWVAAERQGRGDRLGSPIQAFSQGLAGGQTAFLC